MPVVSKIVESYKNFLMVKYPAHLGPFCKRLRNNRESARAEAVTFSLLRPIVEEINIAEDVVEGGVDFLCSNTDVKFIVEVTSLRAMRSQLSPDGQIQLREMVSAAHSG